MSIPIMGLGRRVAGSFQLPGSDLWSHLLISSNQWSTTLPCTPETVSLQIMMSPQLFQLYVSYSPPITSFMYISFPQWPREFSYPTSPSLLQSLPLLPHHLDISTLLISQFKVAVIYSYHLYTSPAYLNHSIPCYTYFALSQV